jgi:hypothetical protein
LSSGVLLFNVLKRRARREIPDYPMTYGQQEAWHNTWDERLAALIEAVAGLS